MAYGALTGNGATLTFGEFGSQEAPVIGTLTSVVLGDIVSIGAITETIGEVDDTGLASTYTEKAPADLKEIAPLTFDVNWSSIVTNNTTVPHMQLGVPGYAILTFAKPVATYTTPATFTGSGFIRQRGVDGVANNERVHGSYEFVFDGKTAVPTWVGAVPSGS